MIRSPHRCSPSLAVLLALLIVVSGCVSRGSPSPSASVPPPASVQPASPPTAPASAAATRPARLGSDAAARGGASSQCLAQIETFAEQHTGNRVMLGQAAFADDDSLVLTRVPRRAADRTLLDGRAATEDPVVLSLLAGPQGCSVELAATPPARDASGTTAAAAAVTTAGSAPASSPGASLPACTCTPLAR